MCRSLLKNVFTLCLSSTDAENLSWCRLTEKQCDCFSTSTSMWPRYDVVFFFDIIMIYRSVILFTSHHQSLLHIKYILMIIVWFSPIVNHCPPKTKTHDHHPQLLLFIVFIGNPISLLSTLITLEDVVRFVTLCRNYCIISILLSSWLAYFDLFWNQCRCFVKLS